MDRRSDSFELQDAMFKIRVEWNGLDATQRVCVCVWVLHWVYRAAVSFWLVSSSFLAHSTGSARGWERLAQARATRSRSEKDRALFLCSTA